MLKSLLPFKAILVALSLAALSSCTLISSTTATAPPLSTSPTLTFSPLPTLEPAASIPFTPFPSPSSPTPSSTGQPVPVPTLTATPTFTPYNPNGTQAELFNYVLGLVNSDRESAGLSPVVLSYNAAAQDHAQDMFDNYFISHWGTDGLKPYMRYTLEGGYNYEQENSAYSGWFDRSQNPDSYINIDIKQELESLEWKMMNDDAASNWGHRDAILNKWHKRVNLGIAYDQKRVALVQQFEGDYVQFTLPPTISGSTLSLSGLLNLGTINNIIISYDEIPQTLTPDELLYNLPHSYSLGDMAGFIVSPPPPGYYYTDLSPGAILASKWEAGADGSFDIRADISTLLTRGQGAYTVSIVAVIDNSEATSLTNYSIFTK